MKGIRMATSPKSKPSSKATQADETATPAPEVEQTADAAAPAAKKAPAKKAPAKKAPAKKASAEVAYGGDVEAPVKPARKTPAKARGKVAKAAEAEAAKAEVDENASPEVDADEEKKTASD